MSKREYAMKEKDNFLGNISAIFVMDKNGNLLNSIHAQNRYAAGKIIDYKDYIGKNVLDMFESLNKENSSIMQCIESGEPVYRNIQEFEFNQHTFYCENLTVPIDFDGELKVIEISRYLDGGVQREAAGLQKSMYRLSDIITQDPRMRRNVETARRIKDTMSPVIIYGESGTGKELFAQGMHEDSIRRTEPFVAQNCAALPENLFESLLFGSVKGAFTGAVDKPGLFELANHGTLFLDEINSLPLHLQSKLLRVVEEGNVRRVGSAKDIQVQVKIITAMNENPADLIERGGMRQDLFYRLNVLNLKMIPLRERKEDIALYLSHFVEFYNQIFKTNVKGASKEVYTCFCQYNWPGNVRELKNVIESSMHFVTGGEIELDHLPPTFLENMERQEALARQDAQACGTEGLKSLLQNNERNSIVAALWEAKGNVSQAAKLLGLPRETLRYKIQKYSITI